MVRVGLSICGSFCTLSRTIEVSRTLVDMGYDLIPILSFNVANLDTRFYKASNFRADIAAITGHEPIDAIEDAEPIGPHDMTDIMLVMPCTGNTLAKVASGITDTPTTMAIKSHIRNNKPVLIALATNDGLGASYANIAHLTSTKNFYFVPYAEDNSIAKPKSLVYRKELVVPALVAAMDGKSLPLFDV